MIRLFQGDENAVQSQEGWEKSCKRTWDQSTPNNLREALRLIWHKIDPSPTWIEIDGVTFEGELFPEPTSKEDRKAYVRIVKLLLQRAATNPKRGKEAVPILKPLAFGL